VNHVAPPVERSFDAAASTFVGRAKEIERLHTCARAARSGHPNLVVVEGEAGVGKTALIRQFLSMLHGFRLVHAACDRSESDLPFGLASQLMRQLPTLGSPGFRMVDAVIPPEQAWLDVGGQLLALLGERQREGPVALVVDDIQWADKPSRDALAFVLRRLWADQVLALVTVTLESTSLPWDAHGGSGDTVAASGLEWQRTATGRGELCRLQLRGLEVPEVTALCEEMTQVRLTASAALRLQRHTGGHPLYLRTLLTELSTDALGDLDKPLPVPGSLDAVVRRQVAAVPDDSRALLQALAVLDMQTPLAMAATVAGVEAATDALEPLLHVRLVDWSPSHPSSHVRIRHPLIRDAVYNALAPGHRRDMHLRAAALVGTSSAWAHRVAATDRADSVLAGELETAAAAMADNSDASKAATWLLWAADLSDVREDRERRLLTAVLNLLGKLRDTRAVSLRQAVESCTPSPLRSCLLGRYEMLGGRLLVAESHFRDAVAAAGGQPATDQIAATAAMLLAATKVWRGSGADAVVAAAIAMTLDPENPGICARATAYLGMGSLLALGPGTAVATFHEINRLPRVATDVARADAYLLMVRGTLRSLTGQLEAACTDLATVLLLRREGAVTDGEELTRWWLANAQFLRGSWRDALITVSQSFSMAPSETRPWAYPLCHSTAALVCAGKGEWDRASSHIERADHWVRAIGPPQFVLFTAMARAALAQARGDHHTMLSALQPALSLSTGSGWPLAVESWWLPMHVEALIGTGQLPEAERALSRLSTLAAEVPYLRLPRAWLSGWLHEAGGDRVAALAAYQTGADLPESGDDVPFFRARLEHARGSLALDTGDSKAAADPLRRAHKLFVALDAAPFIQRCSADLARCQLPTRPKSAAERVVLTERERDIVHLVTRGLTNGEVARELFLSVKTIEYHLGNIYAKLGVKTRRELRAADPLAASTTGAA
jgi:DNA-binding CsgD family transcriptional regulator